jgi:hypothetical protein
MPKYHTVVKFISPEIQKRFNVEARRPCYQAMPQIVITVAHRLKDSAFFVILLIMSIYLAPKESLQINFSHYFVPC